jgi:hypothetical protein
MTEGKVISGLDAGTAARTDVIPKQDAAGLLPAEHISLADVLGLVQVGDLPDLSGTYATVASLTDYLDKSTYDSNDDGILDASAIPATPESNIYYVGKHGNDADTGTQIGKAFLTFSAALAVAVAGDSIVCLDGGTYAEGITAKDGVEIFAPNATLDVTGSQLVMAEAVITFNTITRASGGNAMVLFDAASGRQKLTATIIDDYGAGIALRFTAPSVPIVRCKELYVRGGGIGIADFTGNLHYHLEDLVDIYLDSAGAIGIQQNAAGNSGIATVQHIVEIDGPHAGTIGVQVNAGTLNLICNEISADTAWDVASDATLNIIGCTTTGTKSGIANATIADTPQSNRNALINGGFAVWQRYADPSVAASIDDADYAADRWKVLSSSGSTTTTAARIAGDTTPYACRLTQTSATARRIGMVQFIEAADCQHLRGQQVTVQARVQCSATATIKIGVLQWAGTEDQPTNDPVSSWAATPTWAASYSLAGSGSVALAANTWSDLRATFTLNSSFSNLAIIVWSSDALAQNATLDLSAIQHERGATATPFEVRPIATELALCKRYYQLAPLPERVLGFRSAISGATNYIRGQGFALGVPMRAVPTVTDSNPTWATANPGTNNQVAFYNDNAAAYTTITSGIFDGVFVQPRADALSFFLQADAFSGSGGDLGLIFFGGSLEIYLDAEL